MELEFSGVIWFWRGPAPFHFVTVPEPQSGMLTAASELVTYGWGMIPVVAHVGQTEWTTSLWPKDGGYIVPLKAMVRQKERLEIGSSIDVLLAVSV